MLICFTKINHHCSDNGLFIVAWLVPSHYLIQCWFIVNWITYNQISMKFEWKLAPFHSRKLCVWRCRPNGGHFVWASIYMLLTHCGLNTSHPIWQHISGSTLAQPGNGLLSDSTKPIAKPILTNHKWGQLTISWEPFHKKYIQCCTLYLVPEHRSKSNFSCYASAFSRRRHYVFRLSLHPKPEIPSSHLYRGP